jgi:hypothetical protein
MRKLGSDVLYSAPGRSLEVRFWESPAIAVSCYSHNPIHFSAAARAALWRWFMYTVTPACSMILNLNAPDLPVPEIRAFACAGSVCSNMKTFMRNFRSVRYALFLALWQADGVRANDNTDERW